MLWFSVRTREGGRAESARHCLAHWPHFAGALGARAGTRRVFLSSIPCASEIFGRTRRSFFLPAEREPNTCFPPFSAASSGASDPGEEQVCCEQSAVREESRTPKFYRNGEELTRRFRSRSCGI